jgi:menaquinone-specific isochorismate synthase
MTNFTDWASWLHSGAILGVADGRVLVGTGRVIMSPQPHPEKPSFYVPDFFLTRQKPWLTFENSFEVPTLELLSALSGLPIDPPTPLQWPKPPRERFERAFEYLQGEIRKGVLEKGVPFTFERVTGQMDPSRLLSSLRATLNYSLNRSVMPYGFWANLGDSFEGILGCTPELLFRRDGQVIRTMAMAGTRRHDDQGRLPLLEDPKERREHQVVIDSIVSELQPLGRIEVGATEIAVLPQLSHLKTLINLYPESSKAVEYDEMIRALHPTPALGAFPRKEGWKWLELLETQNDLPRNRYGAPFGANWKDASGANQGLAVVAIRNIQWQDDRVLLCAGCGVIAESELEREWQELEGKIRAVKGILAL